MSIMSSPLTGLCSLVTAVFVVEYSRSVVAVVRSSLIFEFFDKCFGADKDSEVTEHGFDRNTG